MSKYIFITGGVCSSLGKGVAAASIGYLLETKGLNIQMVKIDPYINVDAGTMNPYQHGEVYVTDDGAETDLDLGNYARFTSAALGKENSITTGQIYEEVIKREREGKFLGRCVQVIPHVTDTIKQKILMVGEREGVDITIIDPVIDGLSVSQLIDTVIKKSPDIFGIYITSDGYFIAAKIIKAMTIKITIKILNFLLKLLLISSELF